MMRRVLVVDDSLTVRKRLVEVLETNAEFEVVGEAADGKRGIELCASLKPDVITLDMMMPVMTGLAATEYIMAYCPTPILVVSASGNRGEAWKPITAFGASIRPSLTMQCPSPDRSSVRLAHSGTSALTWTARPAGLPFDICCA